MPQLGETVTEGTVLTWLVKAGDVVNEDDPILEISTDKVDTEVPSPFSGTVTALLVKEGETVAVGANLLELDGDSESSVEEAKEIEEPHKEEKPEAIEKDTIQEVEDVSIKNESGKKLSPVVRKLLSENNINPDSLNGTGKGGRITREDVQTYLDSGQTKKVENPVTEEVKSENKSSDESIPSLRKKRRLFNCLSKSFIPFCVLVSVEVTM